MASTTKPRIPPLPEKHAKHEPGKPPRGISERNAWFASLTKRQKCVAVARDVLLRVASEKIVPTRRMYLWIYG